MNIKTILSNKDAVSLLLLSQINFAAGLDMMKRLKADKLKRAGKNEQDIHPDTTVTDDFADMMPQVQAAPELDVSVNLVGASLILASEITQEDAQFLKSNILSPKAIIIKQMDWTANREAMQRMATASKFGLQVSVDKFLADIKAKQQEPITEFTIEAQSAIKPGIKAMETRHLVHLIEESCHPQCAFVRPQTG